MRANRIAIIRSSDDSRFQSLGRKSYNNVDAATREISFNSTPYIAPIKPYNGQSTDVLSSLKLAERKHRAHLKPKFSEYLMEAS